MIYTYYKKETILCIYQVITEEIKFLNHIMCVFLGENKSYYVTLDISLVHCTLF